MQNHSLRKMRRVRSLIHRFHRQTHSRYRQLWKIGEELKPDFRESKHDLQGTFRAWPELRNHLAPGLPRHVRDRDGHEDRIVELARERDEIRDEVEREREVWNQQRERDLGAPRNPWIPEKPLAEDNAVGDESRDIARITAPAEYE